MSYTKAHEILPAELIEKIQQYVDGACIYIPRRSESKKEWGAGTDIRRELAERNRQIYTDYLEGMDTRVLSEKYCLSLKSIQRIVLAEKRKVI